jgi:hypothetical protein
MWRIPVNNQPPAPNRAIAILVSISPTPTSLEAGASQLFTAKVQNARRTRASLGGLAVALGPVEPSIQRKIQRKELWSELKEKEET